LCDGVQNDRVFKFRRCTVGANACVIDLHSDTIITTRMYCIAFNTEGGGISYRHKSSIFTGMSVITLIQKFGFRWVGGKMRQKARHSLPNQAIIAHVGLRWWLLATRPSVRFGSSFNSRASL